MKELTEESVPVVLYYEIMTWRGCEIGSRVVSTCARAHYIMIDNSPGPSPSHQPQAYSLFLGMSIWRFHRTDSKILKNIEWHSRVVLDMPDLSDPAAECPRLDVSALYQNDVRSWLTRTLSSGS